MKQTNLEDLFEYLPKSKIKAGDGLEEGEYPFYTSSEKQTKYLDEFQYEPGCLVFGTGGKASVHLTTSKFSTSTDCIVVRPKAMARVNAPYVFQYFKGNIQILENGFKGAGLKHISKRYLSEIQVPHPESLYDQIRIADLLGKLDVLISQRKQNLQQLDDLLKSVFLEMFGDPVRNEKGWETIPFSQIGKFASGGTPSKSRDDFWIGEYPWVSPKDMKVSKIFDSEDHIAAKVFDETSLKRIAPGHLLIVVRGMILAHSFPVAINMVDISINQDMKAVKVKDSFRVTYVQHCLHALKRQILKLITTAGHGTKKFDSDAMEKLFIPAPPVEVQEKFLVITDKIERIKTRYQQSLIELESLYGVLSQRAFKGELDLSRLSLPSIKHEEDKTLITEPLPTHVEHDIAINFPDTDNLLDALESADARKVLIGQWLEAYCGQLGNTPFLAQNFMAAAQTRLAELHPETDFELGVNDYEHIKAWAFEALATDKLKQSVDDAGNRILITTVQA
jgi:type I restriction enzyme, S subunit